MSTQTLLQFGIIAFIGGCAVAIQSPLSGIIQQRLGVWESIFIVNLGAAIVSGIALIFLRGGQLYEWNQVPPYALIAGLFGVVIVGSIALAIPGIGLSRTLVLMIVGQLAVALLLEQFGWLGAPQRSVDVSRVLGMVLLLGGAFLVLKE